MLTEILLDLALFFVFYFIFIVLGIIIHELGHLVFGLITGYSFCSFRLLFLVWFREDDKIKFKKIKNMLMGQCLMTPPHDESKFKFVWYNLGGGLFNIAGVIIAIGFTALADISIFTPIPLAAITANASLAISSLIPLNFYVPNDGKNIKTALQSKEARRGFFLMFLTNSETATGKRYRDFDSEVFFVEETADFDNYMIAFIVMCEAARLYDMGEYDKSVEQYSRLNIDNLQTFYKNSIKLEILYYYIVHRPDFEKAKILYNDKQMKTLLEELGQLIPSTPRVCAAYEYFVNGDKEKGESLLEKAKADIENYPNSGIRIMERDYYSHLEDLMLS